MAKASKFAALVMSAVMASVAVPAYAEKPSAQTSSVSMTSAAETVSWNGIDTLEKGKDYVVTKSVTVSKKITVPKGVTITVKNGAKLWVSEEGSLYIKGTVVVEKGSALAVSGRLYQYKSKKLTIKGSLRFGDKSDITLNGKLSLSSAGAVSGEPKKLSLGENAVVSLKGKNSSQKLTKAVYAAQIADTLEDYTNTLIDNNLDLYLMVSKLYPKGAQDVLSEKVKAESGLTLEQYFDLMTLSIRLKLVEEGVDISKIKDIDRTGSGVKVTNLKNCYNELTAEEKDMLKKHYNNTKIVYSFEWYSTKNGKKVENAEIKSQTMALVGDKWYLI